MKRLFTDIGLIAGKDLKIESRSRVLTNQVAPFALMILVLFGIALDADQQSLRNFASGLFWISVLLCSLMAISRSMTIERDDDALAGLSLSGVDPIAIAATISRILAAGFDHSIENRLVMCGFIWVPSPRIKRPLL